jgi:hypothetical protein
MNMFSFCTGESCAKSNPKVMKRRNKAKILITQQNKGKIKGGSNFSYIFCKVVPVRGYEPTENLLLSHEKASYLKV